MLAWTTCDAFPNYVYEVSLQVNAHVLCLQAVKLSLTFIGEIFIGKIDSVLPRIFFFKGEHLKFLLILLGKEGKLVYRTKSQHIQHAYLCFNKNSKQLCPGCPD